MLDSSEIKCIAAQSNKLFAEAALLLSVLTSGLWWLTLDSSYYKEFSFQLSSNKLDCNLIVDVFCQQIHWPVVLHRIRFSLHSVGISSYRT